MALWHRQGSGSDRCGLAKLTIKLRRIGSWPSGSSLVLVNNSVGEKKVLTIVPFFSFVLTLPSSIIRTTVGE